MGARTMVAKIPYAAASYDPLHDPVAIRQVVTSRDMGSQYTSVDARPVNEWAALVSQIPDEDERRSALTWAQYTRLAPRKGWRVMMMSHGARASWDGGGGLVFEIAITDAHLLVAGTPPDYEDTTVALVLNRAESLHLVVGCPTDLYFLPPKFTPGYSSLYFGQITLEQVRLVPNDAHQREITLLIDNTAFIEDWAQAWLKGEELP